MTASNHDVAATHGGEPTFTQIVHWLTGAYANGLPADERTALVAILSSRLTADQIHQVLVLLTPHDVDPGAPAQLDRGEVDTMITEVPDRTVPVEVSRRVASRLARAGWPLG